jgi:cytochrome c oxidase subunit 3
MTTTTMDNISYREEVKKKTSKPLLWFAIISIVMFFTGLTSAVVVSQGGGGFIKIELPFAFTISTVIIIISSVAYQIGLISIKKGNIGIAKISVLTTLILGFLFIYTQFLGWQNLYENGIIAVGSQSTQESSYLYLLTALHIAHLIGGLISLMVVLIKTIKEKYNINNYLGVQISITYWHFLGGLWVYLFLFLRFIIA